MPNRPKVCVIDDEREICDLIRLMLESRHFSCCIAHDGESGLDCIRKFKPVLVILDMQMPKMNGYELLIQMRKDAATRDIPAMVLTGLTMETGRSDEEWRRSVGVDAFMTKPIDPAKFLDKVQELTGRGTVLPREG